MKLVLCKSEVLQTPHARFVVNLDVITVKVVIYAGDYVYTFSIVKQY